jgi:hypothetical protein
MVKEMLILAGVLLTGNGLVAMLLNRRWAKNDKVAHLYKINNRQGKELIMMSSTLEVVLDVQESMVDALHDKGVFNGNSVELKGKLRDTRKALNDYSKKIRDDGLLAKEG